MENIKTPSPGFSKLPLPFLLAALGVRVRAAKKILPSPLRGEGEGESRKVTYRVHHMTTTPTDRAKQDAEAQKGRSVDRDLAAYVHGGVTDRGRPTRPQRRRNRVARQEAGLHGDHSHLIDKDVHGNPWKEVDFIVFAGFLVSEEQSERLRDRLDALWQQIAQFVDFYACNEEETALALDVPAGCLGRLGSPLKELQYDAPVKAPPDEN